MRKRSQLVAVFSAALALLPSAGGTAWAAIRHVNAATGNDAGNDCLNQASPCKTIGRAIDQAVAGDTVSVAAGSYPGPVTIDKALTLRGARAGTHACDVTRTGSPATESVLTGSSPGLSTVVVVTANDVTIDGFTIQGGNLIGIQLGSQQSGARIAGNIVQNNLVGLELRNDPSGNTTVIERNKFLLDTIGIGTSASSAVPGWAHASIAENCFIRNLLVGVSLFGAFSPPGPPASDIDVRDNLFDGNGLAANLWHVTSLDITGNTIKNSTASEPTAADVVVFGDVNQLSITCNSFSNGAGKAIRIDNLPPATQNIAAHFNTFSNNDPVSLRLEPGSYTPVTPGSFLADNNRWQEPTGPAAGEIVDPNGVVSATPFLSEAPLCADGLRLRRILRPNDMASGADVCGTGQTAALNFTGAAGSAGGTWLAVTTTPPTLPLTLRADVLIRPYNNAKGSGLVARFAGGRDLALFLINAGNTDVLTLSTVDPGGQLATLTSVPLRAAIRECVWYRLTMTLDIKQAGSLEVTGTVSGHSAPRDPNSSVAEQIGPTLTTTVAFPGGIALEAAGVAATATNAVVDSSIVNFTQ